MTSANTSTILAESNVEVRLEAALASMAAPTGGCDVCPHPLDEHDRIARRYCTATSANVRTRGCICG